MKNKKLSKKDALLIEGYTDIAIMNESKLIMEEFKYADSDTFEDDQWQKVAQKRESTFSHKKSISHDKVLVHLNKPIK